jgi:hypothetical protein
MKYNTLTKMTNHSKHKAAIPNPALLPLKTLIGEWSAVGSHPLFPDTTLHGRSSFNWLEGGAFRVWHSEIDKEGFAEGVAIFGSDDAAGELYMLYFDERKVSRKYEVSIRDHILKWWRNDPDFSQSYTWTLADDGNTIVGKGLMCRDGKNWERDLDVTYTRIK